MSTTKLDNATVMQKVFSSTEGLIKEGLRESKRWPEWRGAAVHHTAQRLIDVFEKEKAEFLTLCQSLDDMPVGVLAFKKTEAKLIAWKSITNSSTSWFTSGWWGSDVASRLKGVSEVLAEDKAGFLSLWENPES